MIRFLEAPEEDDTPVEEPDVPDAPDAPDAPEEDTPEEPAAPAEDAPEEPAAPAPKAAKEPVDNTIVITGQRPPTTQDFSAERQRYIDDIDRGHIKPETLQDLYGKKDTAGKIGTLFGLLVSGMGSGLSGQPNAVLASMQKEIDNDLEAQKASNHNAQNWFQLSLQHEMQKSTIQRNAIENENTKARTGKTDLESEGVKQDNYLKALHSAKEKTILAAWYKAQGITEALPDGPSKVKADQQLQGTVKPAVEAALAKNDAQTAGQLGMRHALREAQKPKAAPTSDVQFVDAKKIRAMAQGGKFAEKYGFPPQGLDPSQASATMAEAAKYNNTLASYKTWRDAFEEFDKKLGAGKLNENNWEAAAHHVEGQLVQAGINGDLAHRMTASMMPKWDDRGDTRGTKGQQGYEQFKNMVAGTTYLDAIPGLKPPFPAPPKVSKEDPLQKKVGSDKGTGKKNAPARKFSGGQWWIKGPDGKAIPEKKVSGKK